MFQLKDLCQDCGKAILSNHRWKIEYRKFLWFRWEVRTHRDCENPEVNPNNPYRTEFKAQPIPGRQYCDLFGPSEAELARQIYENGKDIR